MTPKAQRYVLLVLFFSTLYWGIAGILHPRTAADRPFGVLFLLCDAGLLISAVWWIVRKRD